MICTVANYRKNTMKKSLKWHISSFNAKSSAVPKEWWPSDLPNKEEQQL